MNTVLLGNESTLIATLDECSSLVCVVAEPIYADAERHFGSSLDYARRRAIATMSPDDFLSSPPPCDLVVSAGFGRHIPARIIIHPSVGTINVHQSLLPAYRGRHPLNWAIINGERQVGVTIHHVSDRMDAGPIIFQEPIDVSDQDNIMCVFRKCVAVGNSLLRRALEAVGTPAFEGVRQDESQASYYRPRKPQDGQIEWTNSARDIANLVRALTAPYPGAYFHYGQSRIVVDDTVFVADDGVGAIGVPVACGEHHRVRTGCGALLLTGLRGDSEVRLRRMIRGAA